MNLEKLMSRLEKFTVIGLSGTDLFTGQCITVDDRTGLIVPASEGQLVGWMSGNVGVGVSLVLDAETGEVFPTTVGQGD